MQQTRYRISIHADGPRQYRTQGAVSVVASDNPMRDAARALLERGADPADRLQGAFDGVQISPMALAALAAPRRIPHFDLRPSARNAD